MDIYEFESFQLTISLLGNQEECIPPSMQRIQNSLLFQMRKPRRQENIVCVVLAQAFHIACPE